MARLPRKHSESGYSHIIIRGNGKQILFEEREDHVFFLSILKRYSKETSVIICAYCLMENHVHLLVYDPNDQLSLFMKKLGVSYSGYFNHKYDRVGHVFQGRYISEPVESESYLLTVFRYILNNPHKAGICPAAEYEWNSYKLYGSKNSFVDTGIFQELIGGWNSYSAFIAGENDDQCLEYEDHRHDDEWAKAVIQKELNLSSGTLLKAWPFDKRNAALRSLKEKGLSLRQIERLTGINRRSVKNA
ncbi:MAG: transposase [Flexilinea sp.]|nr:transposase [Flexilinea sp.]